MAIEELSFRRELAAALETNGGDFEAAWDAACHAIGRDDLASRLTYEEREVKAEVQETAERCEAARQSLPANARSAVDEGRATIAVDPEKPEATLIGEGRVRHVVLNRRKFARALASVRYARTGPTMARPRGRESHRGRRGHRRPAATPRDGPDSDSDPEPPEHAARHTALSRPKGGRR